MNTTYFCYLIILFCSVLFHSMPCHSIFKLLSKTLGRPTIDPQLHMEDLTLSWVSLSLFVMAVAAAVTFLC